MFKSISTLLIVVAAFFCLPVLAAETIIPATDVAATINFFGYLQAAWVELSLLGKVIGVLWVLVPLFSLIVSLTPTPRDNLFFGKYIYPLIELLAMNFFKVKQKPGDESALKVDKSVFK